MTTNTIEQLYSEASGSWTHIDWTHFIEYEDSVNGFDVDGLLGSEDAVELADEYGIPGWVARKAIRLAAEVASSATDAEDHAREAIEAYRSGDRERAAEMAAMTRSDEDQWGDAPVWGKFCAAVEAWSNEADE